MMHIRRPLQLTAQQRAVLYALRGESPQPTTRLRDVRVREGDMFPMSGMPDRTYAIGEPVGAVLRRLEKRGFVISAGGRDCNNWSITERGLEVIRWDGS